MLPRPQGEEPPPGYKKLNMDLNRGRQGQGLYLCYKKRIVRPPSVPYIPGEWPGDLVSEVTLWPGGEEQRVNIYLEE